MAGESSIRERREALGWTQAQLADAAGVRNPNYVGSAERGQPVSRQAVEAIGFALEQEEARRAELARVAALHVEQQALVAAMPPSPEWEALRAAMTSRAIDMLDAAQGAACDAILEFVPEDEARRTLDAYFGWDEEPDPTPTLKREGQS